MFLDIIAAAALLLSAIISFLRGFIREMLTILGVVGGALAAAFTGPLLSPMILTWLRGSGEPSAPDEKEAKLFDLIPFNMAADFMAYGVVFLTVVILLSVVSHLLSGWAKSAGLGALDRSFGVLFGILRAAVFIAMLYLPLYMMIEKETRDQWFKGSKSQVYIEMASGWMLRLLPESMMQDTIKKGTEAAESVTRKKLQEMDLLNNERAVEKMAEEKGYTPEQVDEIQKMMQQQMQQDQIEAPQPAPPSPPQNYYGGNQ